MPTKILLLLLVVCCAVPSPAEDKRAFRAGAAIADITPPLGEKVVGSFSPFPASNIHDALHARCLCLDDGETKLFFVLCDNVGIVKEVYDQARSEIAAKSDIDAEQILMAATHTHSACVSTSPKYSPIIAKGIVEAVLAANKNLQPARIGWGGIDESSELNNRRWYIKEAKHRTNPFGGVDTVRMNPPRNHPTLVAPAGPVDPEISFISVQSTNGTPIALLANYSLHYVGGVPRGDVSADYFGVFADSIGPMIGAKDDSPFVGMMSNGTSGDVNNIDFRFSSRDPKQTYEKYEKIDEVAQKVAKKVAEAHANISFRDWVPLGVRRSELTLKVRKPDEAMQAYFANLKVPENEKFAYHRHEKTYADRVQALLEGPDEYVVPLQAMRIGDLAIASIPFEVITEIGLELKTLAPLEDMFTIELANDSRGYLPTPRQHKLGGYETWMGTNRVQKDASELIVKELLSMMQQLAE
ncbi:hypothetical protein [Stieleria marina]